MRNGGWAVLCRKLHGFVGRGGAGECGGDHPVGFRRAPGRVFYEDFCKCVFWRGRGRKHEEWWLGGFVS